MLAFFSALIAKQSLATYFFSAVVALWAILRPTMIRDDEERPLPPNRLVRVVVVILYLSVYLSLVGLGILGGKAFTDNADSFLTQTMYGMVKFSMPSVRDSVPFLAFSILFLATQWPPIAQLEKRLLVWLFRGSHLGPDGQSLARHLVECDFDPSPEERKRSIEGLRAFNVFLTDNDTKSIRLGSIENWRKVNALLRMVHDWNPSGQSALSKEQQRQLTQLAAAHERKTKLALGIVTLLAKGKDQGGTLSKVSAILDSAPHGDPMEAAEREATLAMMVGNAALETPGETLRVGSKELETYLRPINDYFAVEYQLLLEELSRLAATSLLHAGDLSGERLEELKRVGFGGLGLIERMDIGRLLMFLFAIASLGFAILFFFGPGARPIADPEIAREWRPVMLIMQASIALIMAAAALIGAYVGSNALLAQAPKTPWRAYIMAGLVGILAFVLTHGIQFAVFGDPMTKRREIELRVQERYLARTAPLVVGEDRTLLAERALDRRVPQLGPETKRPLMRIAPFALLPFFIVIGMCRLARIRRYWTPQPVSQSRLASKVWERTIDGMAMAVILFGSCLLAFTISRMLGLMPQPSPVPGMPPPPSNPLFLLIPFGGLGFAIGALVVRDVRLAAHTRMIDREPRPVAPPPAANRPAVEPGKALAGGAAIG